MIDQISPLLAIHRRVFDPLIVRSLYNTFQDMFSDRPRDQQNGMAITDFRNRDFLVSWLHRGLKYVIHNHHWLADYASIRQQPPGAYKLALPWHQDSAVVSGINHIKQVAWVRGYVAWVPFCPIDNLTPTLEVCDSRWPMRHKGNQETGYLETFRKEPRGARHTLAGLAEGDVAVFDINCPHRTVVLPSMTKSRISIDLRFVKRVPSGYKGKVIDV